MFSKVSFDIFSERNGAWYLETSADEEEIALSVAREYLRKPGQHTSVKVMKNTVSFTGNQRASEIFKQKKDPNEEALLVLTGSADNTPLCASVADCYALSSRLALSRLLRTFLEKFQITPTELLHSYSHLKKFDDTASLIGAFFHQVSVAQSKKLEIPQNKRLAELMGYYKTIHNAARHFHSHRTELPKFDLAKVDDVYAQSQQGDAATTAHNFYSMLTFYLLNSDFGSYHEKLGFAVSLLQKVTSPDVRHLLDGYIADCLMMSDTIDSVIGRQYNFNDYLLRLIEIVRGDVTLTKAEDLPLLVQLRPDLNNNSLAQTKNVLSDRILRDVRSDNLLNKREPDQEDVLLKKLEGYLKMPDGSLIGGAEMEAALAGRKLRERKRKLRELGLDDVADSLT